MHIIEVAHAGVITDAPSVSDVGMRILNFLLSVTGIIAILALVLAGTLYLSANGDEGRMKIAKRTATYAIMGISFALGAMILVNLIGRFFSA